MDGPAEFKIKASPGSVIFISRENQQLAMVGPGDELGCKITLPRGQITPIFIDGYADSAFGLRHSRYEFSIYHSSWREVVHAAAFSPRDGAGTVEFKGKLWLIGGWDGKGVLSEVWYSSDGNTWSLATNTAPWAPRHGSGVVVFNEKIWLLGGEGHDDVWNSDDGIHWKLIASGVPWGKRYSPNVFSYAGKLWLMGGQWWSDAESSASGVIGYNDVWSSSDGVNWTQVTKSAPWSPRSLVHGSVIHDNRLWIIGGGLKGAVDKTSKTLVEYNDVWSSADGQSWKLELACAPWKARTHFSVAAYGGRIWLTDGSIGTQDEQGNEVWNSPDGVNWTQETVVPWRGRHASSLVSFRKGLWLIAGRLYNDVWCFYP
jgi:hypothetical protein